MKEHVYTSSPVIIWCLYAKKEENKRQKERRKKRKKEAKQISICRYVNLPCNSKHHQNEGEENTIHVPLRHSKIVNNNSRMKVITSNVYLRTVMQELQQILYYTGCKVRYASLVGIIHSR